MFANAHRGKDDKPFRAADFMALTDGPLAPDPADRRQPAAPKTATRPAAELEQALRGGKAQAQAKTTAKD